MQCNADISTHATHRSRLPHPPTISPQLLLLLQQTPEQLRHKPHSCCTPHHHQQPVPSPPPPYLLSSRPQALSQSPRHSVSHPVSHSPILAGSRARIMRGLSQEESSPSPSWPKYPVPHENTYPAYTEKEREREIKTETDRQQTDSRHTQQTHAHTAGTHLLPSEPRCACGRRRFVCTCRCAANTTAGSAN